MKRTSHYAPFRSRADMYRGRKDPRKDKEMDAMIREHRQATGNMNIGRVKSGPQR